MKNIKGLPVGAIATDEEDKAWVYFWGVWMRAPAIDVKPTPKPSFSVVQ